MLIWVLGEFEICECSIACDIGNQAFTNLKLFKLVQMSSCEHVTVCNMPHFVHLPAYGCPLSLANTDQHISATFTSAIFRAQMEHAMICEHVVMSSCDHLIIWTCRCEWRYFVSDSKPGFEPTTHSACSPIYPYSLWALYNSIEWCNLCWSAPK